jgi:transient receptor potential cation channel subfamily M protein 3
MNNLFILKKALVAAKLNKALAREAEEDDLDSEIYNEFKQYEQEFATLAYGLLDKCYKEDDELTSQLLTYDLVNWSHWTCLSLAVSGNLKDFLSHTACQLLISDLWMGGMKIRKYVTWKIITALLFPPAIFTIQFKSAKELQYMPQTQEEHEQELENQDVVSQGGSEKENFTMDEQANDMNEKEYSDTDHHELSHHHLVGSNEKIVSINIL